MNIDKKTLEVEALAKEILQGQADPATVSFAFGYGSHSNIPEETAADILERWRADDLSVTDEADFEKVVYDAMDAASIALFGDTIQFSFAHLPLLSEWVREFTDSLVKLNVKQKQTA